MRPENDAEYVADWENKNTQCQNCTSFKLDGAEGYCSEAGGIVPPTAHCDYFQSKD